MNCNSSCYLFNAANSNRIIIIITIIIISSVQLNRDNLIRIKKVINEIF